MAAARCPDCGEPRARDAAIDLAAALQALQADDLDAAIEAGLLRWNGCRACAGAGLADADLDRLGSARNVRLRALDARARHRARQQRLERIEARARERRARQAPRGEAAAGRPAALPPAAAAALARAKARVSGRGRE